MAKDLTIKEIATHFNINIRTVSKYLRDGKLHGYKVGGNWRIPKEAILEFLTDSNIKYMKEGN